MELNKKQEEGLKIAVSRFHNREPWTCIAGYAGTGKSTLVSFIIDALDIDRKDVAYIAYTGKAALVLKSKGCANAKTAHKLLYKAFQQNDGTYSFMTLRPLEREYKLIVVDEVSMLPKEMWDLLLSHHIPVIALGDPGQLPPIGENNEVLDHPHIFLDEVMRQAQESEIIRLSMSVREGKPLQLFKGNEVQIISQSDMVDGMFDWADQILCGRNNSRFLLNEQIRKKKWGVETNDPVIGDKVISLHNSWDTISMPGKDPLINGTIGTISKQELQNFPMPYKLKKDLGDFVKILYTDVETDNDNIFSNLKLDYKLLIDHEPIINKETFRYLKGLKLKPFDYAYAITVHKSQGSEYDNILLLEEKLKPTEHKKWLYTGITRAAKKLVIVKDYKS